MITFDIVVADPSWAFDDPLAMSDVPRGAAANYPVLDLEAIKRLSIPAAPSAVLGLWVPSTMIFSHGGPTLEAWGFTYKSHWTWGKLAKSGNGLAFGMGRTFRQAHEICLIGIRGTPYNYLQNKSQRSFYIELVEGDGPGCLAVNERHSAKPEALQDSLDLMWPDANKLELFARRVRPGWCCLGNEIDGRDIRDALQDFS